jgi:hypothetical protein
MIAVFHAFGLPFMNKLLRVSGSTLKCGLNGKLLTMVLPRRKCCGASVFQPSGLLAIHRRHYFPRVVRVVLTTGFLLRVQAKWDGGILEMSPVFLVSLFCGCKLEKET